MMSFPERSAFDRKQFDIVTNAVKWIAMRFAYILYRLGVSANLLDVIALFIAMAGFLLMATATRGHRVVPLIGIALIYFHVFIDFVDGAIARAGKKSSRIGHYLDNLGCDIDRFALLILVGIFTGNIYMIIINAFSVAVFVLFIPLAREELPTKGAIGYLCTFYFHKYSFLSVRFMLTLLPFVLGVVIVFRMPLVEIAYAISLAYAAAAALWLLMAIPEYNHEGEAGSS